MKVLVTGGFGNVGRCYSTKEYFMDWMDTTESQELLHFQKHTYDEAMKKLSKPYRKLQPFMKLFSKRIRKGIALMSPYYIQKRKIVK